MKDLTARVVEKLRKTRDRASFSEMALTDTEAAERRSADPGPLEALFFGNRGRLAHKWVHYLPIYDRILASYKDNAPTMLEIGVSFGGSLEMWRKYFGPQATIFGIDINKHCVERFDAPNQVRIGSQDDPEFLRSVVAEMGAPDIILDDGSHVARHQATSFNTLWPLLKVGGVYMIEDLHTSYWPHFGGGYRRSGAAIELAKTLIDDMHGWYHGRRLALAHPRELGAVHVFDSMVVIEKTDRLRPGHYQTGG